MCITVTDTGHGIPSDKLKNLYKMFEADDFDTSVKDSH